MRVLVTGSDGFLGRNLSLALAQSGQEVLKYDRNTAEPLAELAAKADFVMHLAGINRPRDPAEFFRGNAGLTEQLTGLLQKQRRSIPLLLSSSIQAAQNNDYGASKKQAEDLVFQYGKDTGSPVFVFRLENAFGKWSRPNYNSVVSTFCYNAAHGLPLAVRDCSAEVTFVYVDDIMAAFLSCLNRPGSMDIQHVKPVYPVTLGRLADTVRSFASDRENLMIADMQDDFTRKLYATYLSYLPAGGFSIPLHPHADQRGSFTELFHTPDRGQVSVNIIRPGIVKGNHWHHTKNEKFAVVAGECVIRFRKVGETDVYSYPVSGACPAVVDIPTGYTHSIENTGTQDAVVVMWASEIFNPEHPDTFFEEV